MKKFNTLTAMLILISIMLYATLAMGKQNKGLPIGHSGCDRNTEVQHSNMHDDSCQSERSNNITSKAVFNKIKHIILN
jgi:hypothetical protein